MDMWIGYRISMFFTRIKFNNFKTIQKLKNIQNHCSCFSINIISFIICNYLKQNIGRYMHFKKNNILYISNTGKIIC